MKKENIYIDSKELSLFKAFNLVEAKNLSELKG